MTLTYLNELFKTRDKYKEVVVRLILSLLAFKLSQSVKNVKLALAATLSTTLLFSTPTVTALLSKFFPTFGQSPVDLFASWLLKVAPVRNTYNKALKDHVEEIREKTVKVWSNFGKPYTRMPEEGLSEEEVISFIDHIATIVENGVLQEDISGSIYPYAFKTPTPTQKARQNGVHSTELSQNDEFQESMLKVFTHAFKRSYLWNSLHESEFGVGYWLNYQVVRIVSDLFIKTNANQARDEVMGLITSGGTDSIMNMVRLYTRWGKLNKSLDFGEGVMICCENIHAAFDKGCIAFGITLVKIAADETGAICLKSLEQLMEVYKERLVAIAVSAPSFSLGRVDDVSKAAALASKYGVGLHVDCCLGGFVINFLDDYETNFLDIPGVTSISCDTHKNGWAPKGSSVLLTMPVPDAVQGRINLMFHSSYSIPDWDGGLYGSPGNPGSQHCYHVLQALAGMLRAGKSRYRVVARKIQETVQKCSEIIRKTDKLEILGEPKVGKIGVNLFAFRINPKLNWGKGAGYALAYEMKQFNVVLSAMKDDRLHFAVTARSALSTTFVKNFEHALIQGLNSTEVIVREVREGKAKFGGDAGLYGTLESAIEPTSENTKDVSELCGNILLGKRVATDLVHIHFLALQNPFSEKLF